MHGRRVTHQGLLLPNPNQMGLDLLLSWSDLSTSYITVMNPLYCWNVK